MDSAPASLVERLNTDCFCINVDAAGVWTAIQAAAEQELPLETLSAARPHLLAATPVFASRAQMLAMQAVVNAVEAAVALPRWQAQVLAQADPIARFGSGPRGAFMGYDFHLTEDGPRLIEVNTNAGGAFINALLAQGLKACCPEVASLAQHRPLKDLHAGFRQMFADEWHLSGRSGAPGLMLIVDRTPKEQYLYPEFLLARTVLTTAQTQVEIAEPTELEFRGGALWWSGRRVDMVYNRLTDFDLLHTDNLALRQAALAEAVVMTPGPRHHALYADKRNLVLLSDPEAMRAMGLAPEHLAALAAVPRTRRVRDCAASDLWAERNDLFFKPAGGHAGKAVYRGDKITRRVWDEILASGDYVAQSLAPPSHRRLADEETRKLDIRLYTYARQVQLAAARLYSGQTTNFRTPGGGFAPVVVV
jgi:hypothetical protein